LPGTLLSANMIQLGQTSFSDASTCQGGVLAIRTVTL